MPDTPDEYWKLNSEIPPVYSKLRGVGTNKITSAINRKGIENLKSVKRLLGNRYKRVLNNHIDSINAQVVIDADIDIGWGGDYLSKEGIRIKGVTHKGKQTYSVTKKTKKIAKPLIKEAYKRQIEADKKFKADLKKKKAADDEADMIARKKFIEELKHD